MPSDNRGADRLMEIFTGHGYGGQTWMSDEGYRVRCKCGEEFHVGQITDVVPMPIVSDRFTELVEKADRDSITEAERREVLKLAATHTSARDAAIAANKEAQSALLWQPILAHVRKLFEEAL